jgi:uncharacterized protein involved in response to NO
MIIILVFLVGIKLLVLFVLIPLLGIGYLNFLLKSTGLLIKYTPMHLLTMTALSVVIVGFIVMKMLESRRR